MRKTLLLAMAILGVCVLMKFSQEKFPVGFTDDKKYEEEHGEKEKEAGVEKQMSSWWWSRAYPDPSNINDKFYRGWLHAQAMKEPEIRTQRSGMLGVNNTTLFNGNWSAIGPDQNIGGRILCVAVDPQNSNNLFIGSASGGIWKSTTGGVGTNAWQPVSTGLPVLGVASILIHPTNSNIIYAGTGEVYRTDTSNIGFNIWKARGTYGIGILKSTDGGNTWVQVLNRSMQNLFAIQMMEFDPTNSQIIYACATDGLYRSTEGGNNWTKILDKIYVSDVVINPSNTNEIVAAVGNLTNADKGIYRSTNGGTGWTKITTGLPSSFDGFIRLDNVGASPNMIVASIGRDAGSLNELYRSTNFGASWSVLSNSNHCEYQFWFAHDVAIDPSNTDELMMAGVPLYRYTISAADRDGIGGVHADVHDIEYDPSNNNIVYVACDGGMYKSTNGGLSFSMINGGLQAVQFYASFAVSPTNPNVMIGGLQDNGVVRYNGSGWNAVAGGDGGPCVFHPTNGNIVFASNDARRVLRSTNGGTSFPSEVLSSWAFVADSRTGFMAPVAISKSDPTNVYVASDNLHKSTSTGTSGSWNGNSYGSATNYIEAEHKTGIALAVSPLNANKLYVSTSPFAQYDNDANNLHINTPPNLFKSSNGGSSFSNIKNGLPDRFIMDFAISPTNDDSVWIVLGGFGTSHVYVTANGGASWTNKGTGLPDVPHNAVLLDPNNSNIIYAGNDLGVYMSPDNGNTWYDYNNGFWDATLVMDLVATTADKLVAATHGKGAFVSDLYSTQLPVTLVSFTGNNQGNYNNLQWTTNMEENVSHFELERSMNAGAYSTIAVIPAKNVSTGAAYNYKDHIGAIEFSENMFYRLRMVDHDQQYSYSNVVNIRMSLRSNFIVANNPFTDNLKIIINTSNNQNIEIYLYDVTGKCIVRKRIAATSGINNIRLDNLQNLAAGNYILNVQTKEKRFSQKLLKK